VSIFSQLTEKPWAPAEGGDAVLNDSGGMSLATEKVGLLVFLSAITVLFTLLIISYNGRILLANDWRPMPDPWLLWVNTFALIMSSVAFQRTRQFARRGQIDGVRTGLLFSGGLAFAFLAGQLLASYQLVGLGYYASSNPANAFFYLLTGLHGVHLIGGLVAWGRANARVRRGYSAAQVFLSIELCAMYWHFLLFIWLILFTMMLVT
jgi:cytochrome c oxidase subunit III